MEIFKDIIGYEGLYQVSNLGNVKSLNYNRSGKEKLLKLAISSGYYRIELSKNKIYKSILVHRLVALCFIENNLGLQIINHKNGIRTDNRVENLEWCNHSYNNKEAYNLGLRFPTYKGKYGLEKFNSKPVLQFDTNNNYINSFKSLHCASRYTNIPTGSISNCCRGKQKTAGGFIWRFK